MTTRPAAVAAADTLDFVLHKMDGGGYRHVPVVNDGKPVGIISVRDMLRHITKLCCAERASEATFTTEMLGHVMIRGFRLQPEPPSGGFPRQRCRPALEGG